jgi:uncharacterized protein involved in exopolysaccharide biosynthesis
MRDNSKSDQKETTLFDVILIIFKHRMVLFKTVLIITIISILLSLIWPKTYKSTVRFFPPSRASTGISGLFSSFIQPMITTSDLSSEALIVILQSRTIKEDVIQKFNFAEVYGSDIKEFLIRKLEANILIDEIREGGFGFNPLTAVEFSFLDKDPQRATDVSKYYIEKTDSMIKSLNKERAYRSKEIIEKRYLDNIESLNSAENKLKIFQEKNGIFEIESQTKSIINTMAELKAEIIQKEIEIDILRNISSNENTRFIQLQNEKNAIEKKYIELYMRSESLSGEVVFHPLTELPGLAQKYFSLFREVTVQNKIYEFIYPQYEHAKMQVFMQTQGIQILDPAEFPTYKHKPKRIFIVLSGFMFSLFLSLFIIFIREIINKEKSNNTANYQKYMEIRSQIKRDLFFWKN